jgi:hypothetical protein
MTKYLLSVYMDEDNLPSEEEMQQAFQTVDELNAEIRAAGAWVFGGGLHPADTATTLRAKAGEVMTTDGPYSEAKEQIGGFWVIEAPDLDAALEWGRKATIACWGAVEVRPFEDEA